MSVPFLFQSAAVPNQALIMPYVTATQIRLSLAQLTQKNRAARARWSGRCRMAFRRSPHVLNSWYQYADEDTFIETCLYCTKQPASFHSPSNAI